MEHQWKDEFGEDDIVYYNAKDNLEANETEGRKNRIRPEFKEDPSFKNRLTSYNHTAVHIPTDIYDGSTIVLNELNWTEALQDVFKKNREEDPTLLWQVFGSATGLARYYPASPWMDARKTPSKIDLYDVRRRPWSGSVSGLTLKLIRTSVSEMLETLSDDDYVNVVHFNTKVNNTACFNHLVQANVRNKKILKDAVQNISAKGITNYTKGFEFAFDQLSNPNITRANCNKIIMLFTDGGEERAEEIFSRYNIDRKVRVFTFSVGQHNYDTGPIKWMACANKGYFYEIPSIGAIRINTQEYLDVLGRPMVLADAKQVQWTNVYLDALELGLVITGTLPVFNKTKSREGGSRSQLILGVMGVDVSLDDIKRLTPRFTIGPNGYYFAIDPNGYVLLHPNLQPKNPKFQEPVTLDFLDAEQENDIKVQIRTLMIDRDPGEKTIETLVKSQDERYIDRGIRTYNWAPVNGTDYSLALVLPEYSLHYIEANLGDTIKQAMCEYPPITLFFREYCKDLKVSFNNTQFLVDFNEYIDRKTPNGPLCECKPEHTYPSESSFSRFFLIFFSAGEEWGENSETYDSSFYKRSLDNDIYIFTAPYVNSKKHTLLHKISTPVTVCVLCYHTVVGVKLNVSAWMNSFINATTKKNQVDCVILDDGGFLLMSNQDEYITQIGQFFGEVDPVLMITLVNTSLFSFNKTYDYQSVCDPERETKAAAGPRSIYVPTIADMLTVGWWASTACVAGVFSAYSEDDLSDAFSKESCITEQTQYFFENENKSFSGAMDCGNFLKNLSFSSSSFFFSFGYCPYRFLSATGPDPCVLAQNPRYRKGPDVCFDNNADVSNNQNGQCSKCIFIIQCLFFFFFFFFKLTLISFLFAR
uniref:Calcium voltage-gated channel auxiliary subunit alpha2delta 1 n=1 Tax=Sinocyclocheilus grahami TaxID=75366 RepID=A0A672SMA0_SINGR